MTFVLFSLGITFLAVRLGRQLTPEQNQPSLALRPSKVVVRHEPVEPAEPVEQDVPVRAS